MSNIYNLTTRIFSITTFAVLFCLSLASTASAQLNQALNTANKYFAQHKAELGLTDLDVADILVMDAYTDNHNELTHIYLQQRYNGIEIKDAVLGLHYQNENKILHIGNRFQKKLNSRLRPATPSITPEQALQTAATDLELVITELPRVLETIGSAAQKVRMNTAGISLNDIPAKLVYQLTKDGTLQLAWEVQIYTMDAQHYWVVQVDAQRNRVMTKQDLVISCTFDHAHTEECTHDHTAKAVNNFTDMLPTTADVPEAKHHFFSHQSENISTSTTNFYRVYDAPFETPNHGGRTYVGTAGDPFASPNGWHNDGTLQYNITKGNNVYAYEDKSGGNAGLPAIGGTNPLQSLNFDFPLDLSQDPGTYTDAAVTNLFYWNNLIHDVMYHYGFNETSGNFQTNNFGHGGNGNDAVLAEAQDGGGTNNANFLTLPDGVPGRMQMYLWSASTPGDFVHIESSTSYPTGNVSFNAFQAQFGAAVTTTPVTAPLVMIEANVNTSSNCNPCGCGTGQGVGLPPNNDVNGKIALIKRGDCSFIEKVMGAQMGGAIGVVIYNNNPGEGPILMGGDETGNAITIPAVMVSLEDGLELADEIALGGLTISLKRLTSAPPLKDGDLDNGIIAHEYGHGISTRLTGGPGTTCLGGDEQAGEGWSDFFAYMTTMDAATIANAGQLGRGIGTYVIYEPINGTGIRPARYSRDFAINDYTYANIDTATNLEITIPHGIGFIFATALWEMTWNLIDEYGYDSDLTSGNLNAGNILAIQLVVDGLKLQPCSPTFLESRDAILAADQALTGGANQCFIWDAFAKRGMGFSAVSGTNGVGDEIEAFDVPTSCMPIVTFTKTASVAQAEVGDIITYTLTGTNGGSTSFNNSLILDPLPPGVTYVPNSASNGGVYKTNLNTVKFSSVTIPPGQTLSVTFDAVVTSNTATTLIFNDDMNNGQSNWTASSGVNSFYLQNNQAHSAPFAWFAENPDNASNQTLTLASDVALPADAEMRFWHKYDTEAGFDGGVVEISVDGGAIWSDLGAAMTQNGYNDFIPLANNPLIDGFAFGGQSNGWVETVIDLDIFKNQTVLVRFRFSSDALTPGLGWWIDDVTICANATFIHNTAEISRGRNFTLTASANTMVVASQSQAAAGTPNNNKNQATTSEPRESPIQNIFSEATTPTFNVIAYPNPAQNYLNLRLDGNLTGNIRLEMVNAQGQSVLTQTFQAEENLGTIQLQTIDYPTGMYILNLRDAQATQSVKVMIQKN